MFFISFLHILLLSVVEVLKIIFINMPPITFNSVLSCKTLLRLCFCLRLLLKIDPSSVSFLLLWIELVKPSLYVYATWRWQNIWHWWAVNLLLMIWLSMLTSVSILPGMNHIANENRTLSSTFLTRNKIIF